MNKKEQKAKANKQKKFLKELTELSKKHKIVIEGCGCCGSPFLSSNYKDGEYSYDEHSSGSNLTWSGYK